MLIYRLPGDIWKRSLVTDICTNYPDIFGKRWKPGICKDSSLASEHLSELHLRKRQHSKWNCEDSDTL